MLLNALRAESNDEALPSKDDLMRKLLYPVEQVVLIFFVIACALYWQLGIAFRQPWELYSSRVTSGLVLYVVGLVVAVFLVRLHDIARARADKIKIPFAQSLQSFRAQYLSIPSLFEDVRLVHAVSAMFFVFIELKHATPLVNHAVFDAQLAQSEKSFFGGQYAAEKLINVLGASWTHGLSEVYGYWYPYLAVAVVSMLLARSSKLKQEFFLSFSLCWFFGILIVYCYPTWGPCFSAPDVFAQLPATHMTSVQTELWKAKLQLDVNPKDSGAIFLISGLPSLHLAVALLCSVYLKAVNGLLAAASWVFVVLTAIATIYFGWHFVMDDLAAVPLVMVSVFVARYACRVVEKK